MYWFDDQKLSEVAKTVTVDWLFAIKQQIARIQQQMQTAAWTNSRRQNAYYFIRQKDLQSMRKCFVKKPPKPFSKMTDEERRELYIVFIDQLYTEAVRQNEAYLAKYQTYLERFVPMVKASLKMIYPNHNWDQLSAASKYYSSHNYEYLRLKGKEMQAVGIYKFLFFHIQNPEQFDFRSGQLVQFGFWREKNDNPRYQMQMNQKQNELLTEVILNNRDILIQQMILDGISEEEAKTVFHY